MPPRPRALAGLLAVSAFLVGYVLAPDPILQGGHVGEASTETSELPAPARSSLPRFILGDTSDARAAFLATLQIESPTERIGSWMELGYVLAQTDPRGAFEALAPEIWQKPYYDLRGTLAAEWLRRDPESFLEWAQPANPPAPPVPAYHLAYIETDAALALLPRLNDGRLREDLRESIARTLVDKDPEQLWHERELLGGLGEIIEAAADQRRFDWALSFWERSDYAAIYLPAGLLEQLAQDQRFDLAARMTLNAQTGFLEFAAVSHPELCARWLLSVPAQERALLEDAFYPAETSHAFFRHLLASDAYWNWPDQFFWRASIYDSADQRLVQLLIDRLIQRPDAIEPGNDGPALAMFLRQQSDPAYVASLYRAIEDRAHPLLDVIEAFMLLHPHAFRSELARRATRHEASSDPLISSLAQARFGDWPSELVAATRNALAQLSDQDLQWRLSPAAFLNAFQLDPERMERFLANAHPNWLSATLASPELAREVDLDKLGVFESLLELLPPNDAEAQRRAALSTVMSRGTQNEDLDLLLQLASTPALVAQLAQSGLDAAQLEAGPAREAVLEHPRRDELLLQFVLRHPDWQPQHPELHLQVERVNALLATARELAHDSPDHLLDVLTAEPPDSRIALAQAAVLDAHLQRDTYRIHEILELPVWSSAENAALRAIIADGYDDYSLMPLD